MANKKKTPKRPSSRDILKRLTSAGADLQTNIDARKEMAKRGKGQMKQAWAAVQSSIETSLPSSEPKAAVARKLRAIESAWQSWQDEQVATRERNKIATARVRDALTELNEATEESKALR